MRVSLAISPIGVFACDENGEIISYRVFPKNPVEIATKLSLYFDEERLDELESLLKEIGEKKPDEVIVEDEIAYRIVKRVLEVPVSISTPNIAGRKVRSSLVSLAETYGFAVGREELYNVLCKVNLALTRKRIMGVAERRDLLVKQAIEAVDDINKILNMMAARIREWYSIHFPEMNRLVKKHKTFISLVKGVGLRDNFTEDKLKELGITGELAEKLVENAKFSIGARITEDDVKHLKKYSELWLKLAELRDELEDYIDKVMSEVAPNIRSLVGPKIGARLIALAGGLDKLAEMPASTIQVLGAEKALFRYLRGRGTPPKHGVIFQHPAIWSSPKWQRGKIARALAGKLAIAAKKDFFSGELLGELKKELEKRIEEIKRKYRKPPKKARVIKARKRGKGKGKKKKS